MTGNFNRLFSQDSQPLQRPKHRKPSLRAECSNDTISALSKDTILLDSTASLYPFQTVQRRRILQQLLNRFFKQIRYGCQNPECETPTCLSYQKKRAKGPFRRLSVLSARALASFLANQEFPERRLCPHQPVVLKHAGHDTNPSRRIKKPSKVIIKTSAQGPRSSEDAEAHSTKTVVLEGQEDIQEWGSIDDKTSQPERQGTLRPGKRYWETDEPDKPKDPKSLTQNLFDTFSWKALQSLIFESSTFGWVSPDSVYGTTKRDTATASTIHNTSEVHATDEKSKNYPIYEGKGLTGNKENETRAKETAHIIAMNAERSKRDKSPPISKSVTEPLKYIPFQQSSYSIDEAFLRQSRKSFPNRSSQEDCPPLKGTDVNVLNPFATLSHFTLSNILALNRLARLSRPCERRLGLSMGWTETAVQSTDTSAGCLFAIQSITYVLGTTAPLLESFKQVGEVMQEDNLKAHGSNHNSVIVYAFRQLRELEGHPQRIFPSLWTSLEHAFAWDTRPRLFLPRDQILPKTPSLDRHLDSTSYGQYAPCDKMMHDLDAAHIMKIALSALVASVPPCSIKIWENVVKLRASGRIVPDMKPAEPNKHIPSSATLWTVMDAYEDELAICLMIRLVRAFASRRCWAEILEARNVNGVGNTDEIPADFTESLLYFLQEDKSETLLLSSGGFVRTNDDLTAASQQISAPSFSMMVLEWLRSVLLKEWDGKPETLRWGIVGGALDFMACLYDKRIDLGLMSDYFHTTFISERLDPMEMPVEWLNMHYRRDIVHLLRYPFLFPPATLVTYFRALNHAAMLKAFESSMTTARMLIQMSNISHSTESRLFSRLKTAMANYFVLDIRRDNILVDALNQLWRREKRELMKPLKVRMGMDEGEEGVDHGGVQQEFFRLAISLALNPDYGLFSTEVSTRMSWFQPCPLEPTYKFELIGLLVSLAVYNGLTLPVTFPLALYRKLLDMPVTKLDHIRDGWPGLSKGLATLLNWTDGNVEDVFMRSYVFSVETPTTTIFVDMQQTGREDTWPSADDKDLLKTKSGTPSNSAGFKEMSKNQREPCVVLSKALENGSNSWMPVESAEVEPCKLDLKAQSWQSANTMKTMSIHEPGMVDDQNRERYVQDYIFWLSDRSIRPQYEAFARGFFYCLDKKALSIFTPEALQTVVEGVQGIDLDELEQTAKYENGYTAQHRVIQDFWSVVRGFSADKVRHLLEFVTASDRIPVNGVRSMMFVIQRNGTNNERLPTSLTCFGRLLLPEYSCKEKLEEKLCLAIDNNQGFGVA